MSNYCTTIFVGILPAQFFITTREFLPWKVGTEKVIGLGSKSLSATGLSG